MLDTAVPPAFQFHATKVCAFALGSLFVPKLKPSASNEVTPDTVNSASVLSDDSNFVVPLTESKSAFL